MPYRIESAVKGLTKVVKYSASKGKKRYELTHTQRWRWGHVVVTSKPVVTSGQALVIESDEVIDLDFADCVLDDYTYSPGTPKSIQVDPNDDDELSEHGWHFAESEFEFDSGFSVKRVKK